MPEASREPELAPADETDAGAGTGDRTAPERRQSLGVASVLLASGTLVSRVLGFVRVFVLAQTIGIVGAGADAFANANSIPSAIYAIIAGGTVNAVLVPQIVRAVKEDPDGGEKYVNKLVTLGMLLMGALAILATLGAPFLARLYGAGLRPDDLALVIAFAFWCLPQIFFYGLYTLVGEVLNARGYFGPFTWAQVFNNLVSIAMILLFGVLFGADPSGMRHVGEWTPGMIAFLGGMTTLAVAIQSIICFAFWGRIGLRYRPEFGFRGIGLRKTGALAGWTLAMVVIVQITVLIETNVANLAFGRAASVAAMQNALLIFILPHSIISISIATAYFTRMSEAAADGDDRRLVRDFSEVMRIVGLFIVFSMVGLMVLSVSFSRVFEARPEGTLALAEVLCAFLLGLPAYSVLLIAHRMFYAKQDTKTLFKVFLWTFPFNVFAMALCVLLPEPRIVVALAFVEALFWTIRALVMIAILRVRIGPLDLGRIARSYLIYLGASLIAGAVGAGVMLLLGSYRPDGWAVSGVIQAVLACGIGGAAMLAVYLVALRLLRSPELETALGAVLAKAGPLARRFGGGRGRGGSAADSGSGSGVGSASEDTAELGASGLAEYAEESAHQGLGVVDPQRAPTPGADTGRIPRPGPRA